MDRKEEYKKIIRKYEQDIEQLNKLKKLADDGIITITAHNSISLSERVLPLQAC
jgi:hypothetical protein